MMNKTMGPFLLILFCTSLLYAQSPGNHIAIDISGFEDDIRHWMYGGGKGMNYERYESADIIAIADNLLLFQNPDGGWPKNVDWLGKLESSVMKSWN